MLQERCSQMRRGNLGSRRSTQYQRREENGYEEKSFHSWSVMLLNGGPPRGLRIKIPRPRHQFGKLSPEMLGVSLFKDTEIMKRHLEDIPGILPMTGLEI